MPQGEIAGLPRYGEGLVIAREAPRRGAASRRGPCAIRRARRHRGDRLDQRSLAGGARAPACYDSKAPTLRAWLSSAISDLAETRTTSPTASRQDDLNQVKGRCGNTYIREEELSNLFRRRGPPHPDLCRGR